MSLERKSIVMSRQAYSNLNISVTLQKYIYVYVGEPQGFACSRKVRVMLSEHDTDTIHNFSGETWPQPCLLIQCINSCR